jgi:hypothetical protein
MERSDQFQLIELFPNEQKVQEETKKTLRKGTAVDSCSSK